MASRVCARCARLYTGQVPMSGRSWRSTQRKAQHLLWPSHTSTSVPRKRSIHSSRQRYQDDRGISDAESSKAARKAAFYRNSKAPVFIDALTTSVRGGRGGSGCVSFERLKYVPYGPPSGGRGGRGGDVYIRAVAGLTSLSRLGMSGGAEIRAQPGTHGTGSFRDGRKGADFTISVPVGTIVRVFDSRGETLSETDKEYVELRTEYEDQLVRRLESPEFARIAKEEAIAAAEAAEAAPPARSRRTSPQHGAEDEATAHARDLRDTIWRHYPRGGPSAEEEEATAAYRKTEFLAAEERLAAAIRRDRREDVAARAAKLIAAQRLMRSQQGDAQESVEDEDAEEEKPLYTLDLDAPTPEFSPGHLLAQGGAGGYGNTYFLSTDNRSPKFATVGTLGEAVRVKLEMKVPADVGFVGFPNAGKSSLLQALTGATRNAAKVGGWAFTTLSPNIAVMRLDEAGALMGTGAGPILDEDARQAALATESDSTADANVKEKDDPFVYPSREVARMTLLDLPGLLPGASRNVGLGHSFLRHAERCRLLVYVVDVSAGRPTPWEDVKLLQAELEAYKPGLSDKARIVVANKADTLGPPIKGVAEVHTAMTSPQGGKQAVGSKAPQRLTADEAREKLATLQQQVQALRRKSTDDAGGHTPVHTSMPVVPISAMWRLGVRGLAKRLMDLVKEEKEQEIGTKAGFRF